MAGLYLKRRLSGYIGTLRPLLAEVFGTFKCQLLVVIISSFMAVGFELGGLSLIYALFSSGGQAPFSDFLGMSERGDLGLWVFLPVLLLGAAAFMYFVSAFLTVRLSSLFAQHSLVRLHNGLRNMRQWPRGEVTRDFSTLNKLNRVQRNALIANARVLRIVNSLWVPSLLFLGGYVLICLINFGLGMAIVVVLIVLLCFQIAISLKSAQSNSRWENLSPKIFSLLKKELKQRVDGPAASCSEDRLLRATKKILSAQQDRILVTAYSQAATSIGLVGTLAAMFVYARFSEDVFVEENLSSTLAILVIIIRVFMSLKSLGGQITVINRFYPQLNRYFRLIKIMDYEDPVADADADAGEVRSSTVLTDLPDNRLNRLRWSSVLFGGREIDFDRSGNGLRVHLFDRLLIEDMQEEYIWVDFEDMKNEPPMLCHIDNLESIVKNFKIARNGRGKSEPTSCDESDDIV